MAVTLAADALLVDLISACVGFLKLLCIVGLSPDDPADSAIHPRCSYISVFAQCRVWFKGKRAFYFVFYLYISRTTVLNQCFSPFE